MPKDERPHVAAFPFGASFCLLASRAHFPIDEMCSKYSTMVFNKTCIRCLEKHAEHALPTGPGFGRHFFGLGHGDKSADFSCLVKTASVLKSLDARKAVVLPMGSLRFVE